MTPGARAELQALLQRLSDGDRAAIEPAFHLLWPVLRRFCARAMGGGVDGDDAAQQAIIKLFAQVSGYDSERDALGWALTIAAFECRTLRAKQRRRREAATSAAADAASHAESPEAALIRLDLEAALRDVLGTLDETDLTTLRALLGEIEPPVQGATFRKRVQRALGRLRLAWRTKHDIG